MDNFTRKVTEANRQSTTSNHPSGVRVAVAGISGYAGGELVRLLLRHPRFSTEMPLFFVREDTDYPLKRIALSELHPHLTADDQISVMPFSWKQMEAEGTQILLLATPHEQSRADAPEAIRRGIRVIDLSGAWRLKLTANQSIYKFSDADPRYCQDLQQEAVYGSPELHREQIRSARLVANPGCYATSIILALAPLLASYLVDVQHGIVCDAKSGVSGAGKTPSPGTHFMYAADNLSPYTIFGHRHTGELLEQLQLTREQIQFTPHLLPIPRGLLSTIYLRLHQASDADSLLRIMRSFYRDAPCIRLRRSGVLPNIQHVVRTPFCDLGLAIDFDGKRAVLISCLDNLLKGAASQAIQNLNLMCGWGETEGLL